MRPKKPMSEAKKDFQVAVQAFIEREMAQLSSGSIIYVDTTWNVENYVHIVFLINNNDLAYKYTFAFINRKSGHIYAPSCTTGISIWYLNSRSIWRTNAYNVILGNVLLSDYVKWDDKEKYLRRAKLREERIKIKNMKDLQDKLDAFARQ